MGQRPAVGDLPQLLRTFPSLRKTWTVCSLSFPKLAVGPAVATSLQRLEVVRLWSIAMQRCQSGQHSGQIY